MRFSDVVVLSERATAPTSSPPSFHGGSGDGLGHATNVDLARCWPDKRFYSVAPSR